MKDGEIIGFGTMAEAEARQTASGKEVLYLAEEAQQILHIAIAKDVESGELTRTQLVDIAAELGITQEALLKAEREWQMRREETSEQQLFEDQRRDRLHRRIAHFTLVAVFLLGLKVFFISGITPLLYLLLGPWGLTLIWDAWKIYRPSAYSYTRDFQRWQRKRRMKQAAGRFFQRLLG